MATQRLGIIMHGVTGRMGMNQHLIRSIVAIRAQASTEFGSIQQHAGTVDRAYDDQDKMWVMRVMAEELRHGYQMLHLLLSKDWSHVSGGVTGPQMVEEILSMTTGNHVLDAFNLDYDSFMDNITFAAFIDRVGKYQLTMQKVCAYKPMADSMPPMLREEAFHLAAGVIPLRRFDQVFVRQAAHQDAPLDRFARDAQRLDSTTTTCVHRR